MRIPFAISAPFPLATAGRKQALLAFSLIALTGCVSTDTDPVRHHHVQLGQEVTLIGSSGRPIVKNPDGSVCYGPMPDAGLDRGEAVGFRLASAGDGEAEVPLGGRNPNVLITRDIFFQTCLAEARLNMTREERLELLNKTLDIIVQINAQSLEGEAVKSDAPDGKVTLPTVQMQQSSDTSDY